jgi:hypothetical protein
MTQILAHQSASARKSLSLAGLALAAALALQPAPTRAAEVNPRDFQAFGYDIRLQDQFPGEWRKPNGAEILGGFYGPDDQVNTRTGETRHR